MIGSQLCSSKNHHVTSVWFTLRERTAQLRTEGICKLSALVRGANLVMVLFVLFMCGSFHSYGQDKLGKAYRREFL